MNIDFHCHRFDWSTEPGHLGRDVREMAQTAETVGIRTLSFMDHYFQMEWMAPPTDPMLEGYTALGFVAGCTETLRLHLLVTGVTYRHPGLLAKIIATLDVLSAGRAELGIGAAWYDREHLGLGVPFPPTAERFERLEETLQICLQMWSGDDGPYTGTHYQLAETICQPQPVSAPRPRILIGGSGERKTLRMVAQYADACNIFGGPTEVAHKLDVLRRHCDTLGRDIGEIEVTVMVRGRDGDATSDDLLQGAERFGEIGVSSVVAGTNSTHPVAWFESVVGPVADDLKAIEPAPL